MKDPYSVLGISPNATDEQVKEAYRNLVKKYHPDAYADNPLADLASEKMKEINEAYDAILNSRKAGGGQYTGGGSGNANYVHIRNLINQRQIIAAEEMLDKIDPSMRNAEWYFLKGMVQHSKGWTDEAYKNISTACNMDPGNFEYRQTLSRISFGRNGGTYGGYRTSGNGNECSGCDICQGLICADCCCECMGGDLISCC